MNAVLGKLIRNPAIWLALAVTGCVGQVGSDGPAAPAAGGRRIDTPGVPAGAAGAAAPANGGAGAAAGAQEVGAFDRAVRRLSARELNADVDAWYPELAPMRKGVVDDSSGLFDNSAADLDTSAAWIDGLMASAADVVSLAARSDATRARVRVCKEETSACLRQIVAVWGRRLLRRPLADAEVAAMTTALEGNRDLVTVDDRALAAVEALLHHPEHVFRVETPAGAGRVGDFAIASRMSYALWGRGPDDQLLDQAASGGLADARQRSALAQQMLASPAARRQVLDFHAEWMGFTALPRTGLAAAMWDETRRLVERVVFDQPGSGYPSLFRSDTTYVTPELAKFYGIKAPDGGGAGWVQPSDATRRGILGHGTYLSAHANPDDTSPVKRGKAVVENLLCAAPLVPPPNVPVDQKAKAGQCRLAFFATAHAVGSCAGCHKILDGIGFGLERFDKFGAARDSEPDKPSCPLDGKGEFFGTAFDGPAGLGALIAADDRFDACVARQALRFAVGRDLGDGPAPFLDRARAAYGAGGRSLRELLVAALADPAFVTFQTR